jgi:hypothetical protein
LESKIEQLLLENTNLKEKLEQLQQNVSKPPSQIDVSPAKTETVHTNSNSNSNSNENAGIIPKNSTPKSATEQWASIYAQPESYFEKKYAILLKDFADLQQTSQRHHNYSLFQRRSNIMLKQY